MSARKIRRPLILISCAALPRAVLRQSPLRSGQAVELRPPSRAFRTKKAALAGATFPKPLRFAERFVRALSGDDSRAVGIETLGLAFHDVVDSVLKPFGEFAEILLVQVNLMLLEREASVFSRFLPAFGDRDVIIVVSRRFYVEKVSSATCSDGFGIYFLGPFAFAFLFEVGILHACCFRC